MNDRVNRWLLRRCLVSLDIEPLLGSWDASSNQSQIRLRAYLDHVAAEFAHAGNASVPLGLHVDARLSAGCDLLHHNDLENYLTPLAQRLRLANLVRASATKAHAAVGDASRVQLWEVEANEATEGDWLRASPMGSTANKEWKTSLRGALREVGVCEVSPGPVAMEMVFRCSRRQRNWVNVWKPSGDALGPLLGEPHPNNPFNPADDRVVDLALHLDADDAMQYGIQIAVRCRAVAWV